MRRGYTLVEVLIIVAILGIVSAVIVPQMLTASSLGIQAAARSVVADTLYVQNEAIAHQVVKRIVFDFQTDRYWLENAAGQPLPISWRVGGANLVDFRNDGRFSGIRLARVSVGPNGAAIYNENGSRLTIEFDELGAPSTGGHIGLVAQNDRFRVTIAEFTGRVTVRKE